MQFIKSLIQAAIDLENMPYLGRIVPEIGNEQIREIIYRSYRIVYRIKAEKIEILGVFHGARDFRKAINNEPD